MGLGRGIDRAGAALALAAALAALPAAAPAQEAPSYEIRRAGSPVDVDGRLDEPAWAAAEEIPLRWEVFPGDNVAPPVEAVCRTTYDAERLYIGCAARDPRPGEIRAYLQDRDEGFDDDHFAFLLDPFHDRRRAFEFRVTPLGVQMDATFDQGNEDFSWDTIWESAGRIDAEGYVVELAIPFKSLRFPRAEGVQTWGLLIERSYPRSSRHRIASAPRDRGDNCLLCQANRLSGFQGIAPGHDVELDPTLTAIRTEARDDFPAGDLEVTDEDLSVGLTGHWGITPNLALSGTVNPDFSQVEADAGRLDVNERFTLFFPEKRPFFLEGADFFEVADLVFTRTVADPVAGVKLFGKEGANAFGAFATRDRVNNLILPGARSSDEASTDDDVTGAVMRWRRDVGVSSTLGTLVTLRETDGYSNRLAAVDGFLRLTPAHTVQLVAAASRTDYPAELAAALELDPEPFDGFGGVVGWDWQTREWQLEASWEQVGEDLRADSGFLPQVGYREFSAETERTFWGGSDRWFDRIDAQAEGAWSEDADGRLLERTWSGRLAYEGPRQTSASVSLDRTARSFAGRVFELTEPRFSFGIQPAGWISAHVFVGLGHEIDFANARLADEKFVNPSLALRLGRPLELSIGHEYQRLADGGEEIFTANLTEVRAVWHFNVRARFRAIVQLEDVERNPAAYGFPVEPESREVFTQLLFSYEVNPRTVLYAGYTDEAFGDHEIDLTRTDRTLFFKLGYAWRL